MVRFMTLICPSVYGWKAILCFNLVSIILHKDLQNLLRKWQSRSEIIEEGSRKSFQTNWKNNRATSSLVTVFLQGMRHTILPN